VQPGQLRARRREGAEVRSERDARQLALEVVGEFLGAVAAVFIVDVEGEALVGIDTGAKMQVNKTIGYRICLARRIPSGIRFPNLYLVTALAVNSRTGQT
jgi:hypothetical protein